MNTFLKDQALLIFNQNNGDFDDISIIIPNKRAAVYLQKHLSDLKKRPFFSPEIITINEWIDKHTTERILNSTELLFILYKVHCEIELDMAEDFESFSQWGKILLSDFDEIDRYLIEPESIFKNLQEIKKIENWSFGLDELSIGQERFKNLWDKLIQYYHLLQNKLKESALIYAGKAYSNFHKNLKTLNFQNHHYFLGFNAISKSEQQIMAWLKKDKKATVIFDVDKFYFDNESHEAGYFYHKICTEWELKPEVSDNFNSIKKAIEVIETSQQTAQTKICGNIIKKLMQSGDNLDSTAIVLADESLLIPLTKSLPAEVEAINITMGYPIKFSHLKGLIDIIFEFQFNYKKFNSNRIYHKSLIHLLQQPYVRLIINDEALIATYQNDLAERNVIFLEHSELLKSLPALASINAIINRWPEDTAPKMDAFEHLIEVLHQRFTNNKSRETDLELLYQFSKGTEKFKEIWEQYEVKLSLRSFKNLFYQFWQGESLSFLGNPINGLQVLGILETRTIDFENLIILGMNEGSLPKSNVVNSMIPRDLRLFERQLPTEEDRQAIFAHHFYRLIQRSKNVYMTYNSHSEGLGGGEQSRFITQMENEIDFKKGHTLTRHTYSVDDESANTTDIFYKSTPELHLRLDKMFESGLSPSALNKFIACPLDFYYRYIIGLKEEGEVEENIESSTFGTKIHDVLEGIIRDNFFKDDTGIAMTVTALKAEKKKVRSRLTGAYLNGENSKNFSLSDLKYGQNKLSFDVSEKLIQSFIDAQIKEISESSDAIIPIALELKDDFFADLKMDVKGVNKKVRIKGTADRIDKKGSVFRIIDYKSGKCDETKVKFQFKKQSAEEMARLIHHDKKSYARQLLMYALMFRQQYSKEKTFAAGIISMVNMSEWVQNVRTENKQEAIASEMLDLFKDELTNVLSEMYSDDFEFRHNPKSKYCEHCGK